MTKALVPLPVLFPRLHLSDEQLQQLSETSPKSDRLDDGARYRLERLGDAYTFAMACFQNGMDFEALNSKVRALTKHVIALREAIGCPEDMRSKADFQHQRFRQMLATSLAEGPANSLWNLDDFDHVLAGIEYSLGGTQKFLASGTSFGETPQEHFDRFALALADFFEGWTGSTTSVWKSEQGASRFLAFVFVFWKMIPAYNQNHRSIEALRTRLLTIPELQKENREEA
jgi:hypothetical protein